MTLSARCLLPVLMVFALVSPALADPALWEVRDDDSSIWLFGSFHILPEGTEWRTELFDGVLAEADSVVFETDVRPAAIAQMGANAFARGIYVDGTLLTDVMDEALEAQLRQQAAAMDMPMGMVLAMRPWMATNTITVQMLAAHGYQDQGVEFILQPEISEERLGSLETGAEQLEVLAGAPDDEQLAMLQATLDQLDALPKLMDKMKTRWVAGTPEQLADLFLMELGGFETAFLDRLLYARNQNWLGPIEAMLAENRENLVIVGAAHLIGDGSVLDLLEHAGYQVQRVQ
ncbi:TraB/GumN family protein [Devosia sp. A449]